MLAFGVTNGSATLSEAMRINNLGNVGIGTTGPGGVLDVATASSNYLFGSGATTGQNPQLGFMDITLGISNTVWLYHG